MDGWLECRSTILLIGNGLGHGCDWRRAWATGGVASDGTIRFMATGNTFNTGGNWGGGEAIIRFQPGPNLYREIRAITGRLPTGFSSTMATSIWVARVHCSVDVPGAIPSSLVVALGKDGNAYLPESRQPREASLRRSLPCSCRRTTSIIQAAASYRTSLGYLCGFSRWQQHCAFCLPNHSRPIRPRSPMVWTVDRGNGSELRWPFVTSTDGTNNVSCLGRSALVIRPATRSLHGYDGDTGAAVFAGGGCK